MGELLNVIGLGAGVALYAMLLLMVLGVRHASAARQRVDPLLLLTSVLGLVWNLCAFSVYELPRLGVDGPFPTVTAVGLASLGFLPAVVVHSVLRNEQDDVRGVTRRALAALSYALSACAAGVQLWRAVGAEPVPAPFGLQLLTYAYLALIAPVTFVTRGQPGSRRTLWVAALAIFAVSALHLSQLHRGDVSWPIELVGHHASLPLALAILYQDYPFALADLFLKRTLALLAIIGIAFGAVALLGALSPSVAQLLSVEPRQMSLLVTLCAGTALAYPAVRRATAWFVDSVVLARPNYPTVRADLVRRIQTQQDVTTLLDEVCSTLSLAMNAVGVTWHESAEAADHEPHASPAAFSGDRATVDVPTSDPPHFAIQILGLKGGRRLLSDDLATLDAIANAVARRIDAIRITKERYERAFREQEMATLASEAELRALRAQINPHFLFNALTTIGYLIQTSPPRAVETLMRLTALLRSVLRSEGEFTTLGRELDLVESYLDIERARFEHRLRVTIDVPEELRHVRVPPFVIQPLVENAVKHGISRKDAGGAVIVRATSDQVGLDACLSITVSDTGVGASPGALARGREAGIGLRNVERRLACHYGPAARFAIQSVPDKGTTVTLDLPLAMRPAGQPERATI